MKTSLFWGGLSECIRIMILEYYVVEKYIWQLAFIVTSRVCANSGYLTLRG
jgi:hypothetical protein